jgi:O-antigen/teichoic acid export membrane protein
LKARETRGVAVWSRAFRPEGAAEVTIEEERYGGRVGRIARGAGIGFFGTMIGRALGLATQVALARMYGPALLGYYVLGMTVTQLVNVLSQFGMDNGVVRYVAHYRAENDDSRVRGTIFLSLAVTFCLSVALSVLLFLSAGFIANNVFSKPFLETVLRLFSVAVPFLTLMNMSLWATQGFQTVKYNAYVLQFYKPLMNLTLVITFYLLGAEILGAVAAYITSTAAGSAIAIYYLRKVYPRLLDRSTTPKVESRAIMGASAPMIVANFTQFTNSWSSVTILGIFATAEAVGVFNAAVRVAVVSALVLHAFSGIFSPMISDLHKRGLLEELSRLYRDVSRWSFTGTLGLCLLTTVLSDRIMMIFGERFVSGWPVIAIVASAQMFYSSVGPASRLLAMTGHQNIVMLGTLGSVVSVVILGLALTPIYGVMGAAVGMAGGIIITNVITVLGVRWRLGFWPYSRQYTKPLVAGLTASVVVLLAKLVVPSHPIALPLLATLFGLTFVGALLALGLEVSDRQFVGALRSRLARAVPRRTAAREGR